MLIRTEKRVAKLLAALVAVAAVATTGYAQLPGLGGGGGGGGDLPSNPLPGVNDLIPGNTDRPNIRVPNVDVPGVNLPDVENNVINPQIDSNGLPLPGTLFSSPSVDSGFLGEAVPLKLELGSSAFATQSEELGLNLNTTGNRLAVGEIDSGSLAAGFGFQAGDELMAIERSWIRSYDQFSSQLAAELEGDGRAWVLVRRDGQQQWVNFDVASRSRPKLGVNTSSTDGALSIANVTEGSAAAAAGLQAGDQLVSINGTEIHSHGQLLDALTAAGMNDGVLAMVVSRNGVTQNLMAEVGQITQASGAIAGTLNTQAMANVAASSDDLVSVTEQIAGSVQGAAQAEAQEINSLAQQLQSDVTELQGDAAGDIAQRLGTTQSTVDELEQRLGALTGDNVDAVQDQIAEARQTILEIRQSLNDIGSSATGATQAVSAEAREQMRNVIASTRQELGGIAGSARQDLQERFAAIDGRLQAIEQMAAENAQAAPSALQNELSKAQSELAELKAELDATQQQAVTEIESDLESLGRFTTDTASDANGAIDAEAEADADAEAETEAVVNDEIDNE